VIRHLFVGSVRDGESEKDVDRLAERWGRLPGEVPGVRPFSADRNVSPRDHRYSVAVVADFADIGG
jgi:Stress responsive A/B Barrel Domain